MEKQLGGNYDHATDRPAVRTLEGLGHSADGVRLVDLVRPSSNRAQIPAGAGLYAIYETGGAEEPVYIGKSTNLRSRIGRLLGGALTGAEGHIAGWRIGNGDKNTGDAPVRVEVIEIHWWPDLDLHGARRAPAPSAQEAALIKRHNPQLNTQHTRATLGRPKTLDDDNLRGALRDLSGAESAVEWKVPGWSGWWASCVDADTVKVYVGRADKAKRKRQRVGLWASDEGKLIFPLPAGSAVITTEDEFYALVQACARHLRGLASAPDAPSP